MAHKFRKRIFTAKTFAGDIAFLLSRSPQMIGAFRNQAINSAFVEKIMLVTTAVNDCTYCAWFHAKRAAACGISHQEVSNMLNLQFAADASDFEAPALLYAQHFAETNRQPDDRMTAELVNFYGEETARDILLFIRMIWVGNLAGNTWDAVISRVKGNPAEGSSALFELFFFSLTCWFMGPAMWRIKRAKA